MSERLKYSPACYRTHILTPYTPAKVPIPKADAAEVRVAENEGLLVFNKKIHMLQKVLLRCV